MHRFLLAGDREFERLDRGPHLVRRNVEPELFRNVVVGDDNLPLPRYIAANLEGRPDDLLVGGMARQAILGLGQICVGLGEAVGTVVTG